MERLTYIPIPDYDRRAALDEIDSGAPDRIVLALLALASSDADWQWAQSVCVEFSQSPNDNIRGTAILCFGYIARCQGRLDTEVAIPIVIEALSDPSAFVSGYANDALDDILMYCIPEDYDRSKAIALLRSERIDRILLGLFTIAKRDIDSQFAQDRCIEYSTHPNDVVRGKALEGFATIVWEHRPIDVGKVVRILSEATTDEGYAGSCARSSLECIETYLRAEDV